MQKAKAILRRAQAAPAAEQPCTTVGTIRVGVACHIPDVLTAFGLEPGPIVSHAGLSLKLLGDGDNIIPYAALGRLVDICVQRTSCPHFALLVGERGGLASLGPLGLLIQLAPDVRSALQELVLYLHIHDRGAVPSLEADTATAVLSYSIYEPRVEAAEQIADGAMAVAFNILRSLCGPEWLPTEVTLPRAEPSGTSPYQRVFQAPVRFNSEQAALVFSADWLDRKLPGANSNWHRFVETQLKEYSIKNQSEFSEEVRRVLRTQLMHEGISIKKVSRLFKMNRRTLSRRLQSEGTSFIKISNQVRFEIARQLVAQTEIPLAQIAAALDYAEPSAFSHAFRRWSGCSPAEWRSRRPGNGAASRHLG